MISFLLLFDCSKETLLTFLSCLSYFSVDDGFPTVTFKFEESLILTVYAHEYLFQIRVSNLLFFLLPFVIIVGTIHVLDLNMLLIYSSLVKYFKIKTTFKIIFLYFSGKKRKQKSTSFSVIKFYGLFFFFFLFVLVWFEIFLFCP